MTDVAKILGDEFWPITEGGLQQNLLMLESKLARGVDVPTIPKRVAEEQAGVYMIPIFGAITKRPSLLSMFFGGSTTDDISRDLQMAIGSKHVGSIILNIDSPGGAVSGVEELSNEIFESAKRKRVVAIANSMAGSAALWLGSQANELVVTPSGEIGSVGVLSVHADHSKELDKAGIKVTVIKSSPHKDDASPFEPLADSAKSYLQTRVDEIHKTFVEHLARGRRVSAKHVRERFGQGRMVSARNAVAAGMADRVATLNQVIDELSITNASRPRISERFSQGSWEIAESRARIGSKLTY